MLKLAPSILADLESVDGTGPVPSETELGTLTPLASHTEQEARFRELCRRAETVAANGALQPPVSLRRWGFRHQLETARRYRSMLESGEAPRMKELAEMEGRSRKTVYDALSLLLLPSEVIARIDVPADQAPEGVRLRDLRRIARIKSEAEQLVAWRALLDRCGAE